ncbi:MAG: hypothetical protein RLY58_1775, partial [Pseudomonadota bacterium]
SDASFIRVFLLKQRFFYPIALMHTNHTDSKKTLAHEAH